MPFKSQAQRRKFAQLLVEGKISNQTLEEWNRETGGRPAGAAMTQPTPVIPDRSKNPSKALKPELCSLQSWRLVRHVLIRRAVST
jgi:hypothetical protein